MLPRPLDVRLHAWLRVALALATLAAGLHAQAPWTHAPRPRPWFEIEGARRLGQPMTLTFATAVDTDELAHPVGRNPFLDYRLRVTFTHRPSGLERRVNGYYAADGAAADTSASGGNRWRAHFTPELAGTWEWRAEFRRGAGIALSALAGAGADPTIDSATGALEIGALDPGAPGFLGQGRLDYVGEFYFRFAGSGAWFLKGGMGGPENVLAYFEFDGTSGDPLSLCLPGPTRLHRFLAHAGDFTPDAVGLAHLWGAGTKGQNLLGALDYLASQGVNSLYFIADTYQGDGRDVWPWVTPTDKRHFDVSKLAQWERVFAHMSARGLQLQFVFEEHENDEIPVADGGLGFGLTDERRLYYREMVARFAHHPAVIWVTGDESDYFDDGAIMESFASELRALDPYAHPLAFHGKHPCFGAGCPEPYPSVLDQYAPYFASPNFEASAFQTSPGSYNSSTASLRLAQASSRRWAHHGDEQSLNATAPNLAANRTRALWGNLMGGGAGIAWYPGNAAASQYPPGANLCDYFDLGLEDFRVFEDYFVQTRIALELFHAHLPFTEMVPDNGRASVVGATDYVFLRPESGATRAVYAVYRGTGSATGLLLGEGTHTVEWFDPRTGAGPIADADLIGPGTPTLTPPPQDPGQDWLAIVRQQ